MSKHTRQKDLALFLEYTNAPKPKSVNDIPLTALVPAYAISEMKTAFQIGFMIFIPFLVIDMIVASVLMSMGMMMLPPVMIALPFKILLFVLVDGWNLVVKSLLLSFQ
jgi:flagellar biosynthesis protein FliP